MRPPRSQSMPVPLRVLIAEDSEDDARLLLRELQRAGYQPTYERVDNPAAMAAALDRHAWDLVIGDYSMPAFSGPAALALLRARDLDTPFIFVSGTIGEDVAVEAMKAGAQDFLTKRDRPAGPPPPDQPGGGGSANPRPGVGPTRGDGGVRRLPLGGARAGARRHGLVLPPRPLRVRAQGVGGGRERRGRGRRTQACRGSAAAVRGATTPGAEDGGGRPAGRRGRPPFSKTPVPGHPPQRAGAPRPRGGG